MRGVQSLDPLTLPEWLDPLTLPECAPCQARRGAVLPQRGLDFPETLPDDGPGRGRGERRDGFVVGAATRPTAHPPNWHEGNRQLLNAPLDRVTESAFGFAQHTFANSFMRRREELWVGAAY